MRYIVLFLGIGIFFAQDPPVEFQWNQSTEQASYVIYSVIINGSVVESDDWVGAFNGDICVGSFQWDTSQCNNETCSIVLMGYNILLPETEGYLNSGDFPTFKIYDTSSGIYYDAIPSQDFAFVSNGLYNIDSLTSAQYGCNDESACNYNPEANADDGSCDYAEENYDCAGNCIAFEDNCGTCDYNDGNDCVQDCAGIWGGSAIEDCAGDCGGNASVDNCGTCDDDSSNDCEGAYDNCGVWNGDNSDCWYIDIEVALFYDPLPYICIGATANSQEECDSMGGDWMIDPNIESSSYEQDLNNRIGMHTAADDSLNFADHPDFQCGEGVNCYADVIEPPDAPNPEVMLYFPHPEWENPLGNEFINYTRDIRELTDLSNFQEIKVWDAVFSSNIENKDITLSFDFINQATLDGEYGYTRVFVLHDSNNDGQTEYTEIEHTDTYSFFHTYADVNDSLKIIVGTPEIVSNSNVTVISPNGNDIHSTEDDLIVDLEYELIEFIGQLKLNLDIMECSNPAYTTKQTCENSLGQWYAYDSQEIYNGVPLERVTVSSEIINNFYDQINIDNSDYLSRFSIHAEIIDLAGGSAAIFEDYQDDSDNTFTISKPAITTDFDGLGWHLLTPPLASIDDHILEGIFTNPAYGCSDGCSILETANSGIGFYVQNSGSLLDFTFTGQVLSEGNIILDQGWNLVGNPLVTSIDVNSLNISYNDSIYSWIDAAKHGYISPTPIIYDNQKASHVGTESFSTATGFWVESHKENVEILFDSTNPILEIEPSLYWNLSLFAKENYGGANYDNALGSEIIIGIHEEAHDVFVEGEDQEHLPLEPLKMVDIINSYTQLSINNNGESSIYRDIRSYHETSITWDISVESVLPFNSSNGILLSWESPAFDNPYDYYLDISGNSSNNCESYDDVDNMHCINMKIDNSKTMDESGNASITAVLKSEYIGCTHPEAFNYNQMENGVFCAGGICLGGNQSEYCEILALSMPEFWTVDTSLVDQSFDIPISLINPQNLEIEGLQFSLEYDANMVQLNEVSLHGNLDNYEIFQENCIDCSPNAKLLVTVYAQTNYTFSGSDTILFISGMGLEDTGTTTISFSSVQINENDNAFGNECVISFETIYLNISGELIYYSNGISLPIVQINLAGIDNEQNYSTETDDDGNFIIESAVGDADYEITLFKDELQIENYYDGLSAVDASRIARHSVGLYDLTNKQQIAANVNFDYRCEDTSGNPVTDDDGELILEEQCNLNWVPNIEAGDASKVARYAAGIIDHLDEVCDPHWIFHGPGPDYNLMIDTENCTNISYGLTLNSNISGLTFEGIRLGDVTGNWTAPLYRQNDEQFVANPVIDLETDEIIKLPIFLPNDLEIEGIDLTIQYDPEVFLLLGFNNSNSILDKTGYPTLINEAIPGEFKLVSYANSTPINDSGLLGYIRFKVISQTSTNSTISIKEMKVNEIIDGGFLIEHGQDAGNISRGFDYKIVSLPKSFALKQNYPNPFNPTTNIRFDLPKDSGVQISIYDIRGLLVDEVVNSWMEAGYYQLIWNGSYHSSGIYFIRMIADNGSYQKTMKTSLIK